MTRIFYVHIDETQHGPFTIAELSAMPITHSTLVWYTGAENWMPAHKVEELRPLLDKLPPVAASDNTRLTRPAPAAPRQDYDLPELPRRNRKPVLYIAAGLIAAVILMFAFLNYRQAQHQVEELARQTAAQQTQKLESDRAHAAQEAALQRQLAEQRAQMQAEERQRQADSLQLDYDKTLENLDAAKEKLEQVRKFRLLRSKREREQQIREQEAVVQAFEHELSRIRTALAALGYETPR